ncbi:sensor histidine kinase [Flavobacterium undicola]|uniref:sensor histidine kinase n=1 Tax=Flavobacterium undicola TaxID=1932779 RepID=UPI0013777312|nr:histidine kinase [Flavobacterium undicola]MBA0885079.1 histidine kinase [Flavobacterium undicola]
MKKLIALILILVITSFVVVSKDDQSLSMKIAIENSKNPNPKNKNWEYVKDRLFDGETENVYKLKEPILIDLTNATKQDSLAVEEIIKELRTILPNKTIDYFNNFTDKNYGDLQIADYNKKIKGISVYELRVNTIKLNFEDRMPNAPFAFHTVSIDGKNKIYRTEFTKYGGSIHNENSIIFSFNKVIPYEKRKRNIQYEILRTLCYINPDKQYPIQYDRKGIFETPDFLPDQTRFNQLDQFLLQKLYSDDFVEQFREYMYVNYPWRYASSFTNKKMHEFKVWGIIIGVGIVAFILMFSYFQNNKFKYSYLNYLFPIFLILLYFINFVNLASYLTSFNSVIGLKSHIFFQIPLAIVVSILMSFFLWGSEKICLKGNENFSYQLILKVSFTFITFILPMSLIVILNWGQEGMVETMFPYLLFVLGLAIGRGLLLYLNHFSESLVKEKDLELSRLKEAKAQAEVKMLQSQINPHFLYNALNSIASLAHTDADKTEKMALSLSDLFRHSINQKEKKVNTLGDEIYLVRNYLEIEQIRFGDRLNFNIDVESDLLEVEIPMFILQPLVENAIKHGISKIEGQGEIILKVKKKDNSILISVQDNGPDFPEGLVSGHGLQTVYDLLRFSYGDKAVMSWYNQPQKEITIYIML